MKIKIILTLLFSLTLHVYQSVAQAPQISYPSSNYSFPAGMLITPVRPINNGGNVGIQVTTFAGDSIAGYIDSIGNLARFNRPYCMVIDNQGCLYVSERFNHRIRKIYPNGNVITFAGNSLPGFINGQGANSQFNEPCGLAIDSNNNLYVVDIKNYCIRKITPSGVVSTYAGNGLSGMVNGSGSIVRFGNPFGIVIDKTGNLFVSDWWAQNHRIRKIDTNGVVSNYCGTIAGFLDGPANLAQFRLPAGLAIDDSSNIFVADIGNDRIRKIDYNGVVTTVAGSGFPGFLNGNGTLARFCDPLNIVLDANKNLLVTETCSNRIRIINNANVVSTLIGGNGNATGGSGNTNGPVNEASFNLPTSVAIDSLGDLFITDSNNHSIKKVKFSTGSYQVNTPLPPGLSLDTISGVIRGTPLNVNSSSSYIITATNSFGSSSTTITIETTPSISIVQPSRGGFGTLINIRGIGFLNVSAVNIGGFAVKSFKIIDNNNIQAVVGNCISGTVSINTSSGIVLGPNFNFVNPPSIQYPNNSYVFPTRMAISPIIPINSGDTIIPEHQVVTIAGNGLASAINDSALLSSFNNPSALVTDKQGNIYIADQLNHRIRKISTSGIVSTFAGSGINGFANGQGTLASFSFPSDLAIDDNGNVYVADMNNHRIRRISASGMVTTYAGNGIAAFVNGVDSTSCFNSPTGIAVDKFNNVYVADKLNHRIRVITPNNLVGTLSGSGIPGLQNGFSGLAQFNQPSDVIIDDAGDLFVTELGNDIVRRITPLGVVSNFSSSLTFFNPTQLASDNNKNICVGSESTAVLKLNSSGQNALRIGSTIGFNDGSISFFSNFFNRPSGVAFDPDGNLLIADQFNHRIRKVEFRGYSISPVLPQGLSIDDNTGVISGIPLVSCPSTDYIIIGRNSGGESRDTINIQVNTLNPPVITVNNNPLCSGSLATFTAISNNAINPTFQWIRNGNPIPGATLSSLSLNNLLQGDTIQCSITNAGNLLSNRIIISLLPPPSFAALSVNICPNQSFSFNGNSIASPGVYYDTLVNYLGCDSIIILTVISQTPIINNVTVSICQGQTFNFNNQILFNSGFYRDTLLQTNGCDSIINLNLFVYQVPVKPVISRFNNLLSSSASTGNQWYLVGTGAIAGATGQVYTPNQANGGRFYVISTVNGCSSPSSDTLDFIGTGLAEQNFLNWQYFPNPASQFVNVRLELVKADQIRIDITDLSGRIVRSVYEGERTPGILNLEVPVSDLAQGLYLIRLSGQKEQKSGRLLIQR